MSPSSFVRFSSTALIMVVWVALQGASVQTQQRGGTVQTDKVPPVNSGANPYRVIRDWAQLQVEGRPWGGSNGVAIDRDGKSVWATDRCSPGTAPGCLGTKANPVHHFDESGKEIRSFGGGMFAWPHGIRIDRFGNLWITDGQARNGIGQQVFKYSPDGRLLMTLGTKGVRGEGPDTFGGPCDVAHCARGSIGGRKVPGDPGLDDLTREWILGRALSTISRRDR